MELRWDRKSIFVVAESRCGAAVTLFDLLGLKDTMLDAHPCKLTMAKRQTQLRVYCTLKRSLLMRSLRLPPYVLEI